MGLAGRLRSAARTFVGLGSWCLRPTIIPLGVCLDLSALHVLDSTADPITFEVNIYDCCIDGKVSRSSVAILESTVHEITKKVISDLNAVGS
jgi:hypothetical protein